MNVILHCGLFIAANGKLTGQARCLGVESLSIVDWKKMWTNWRGDFKVISNNDLETMVFYSKFNLIVLYQNIVW